MIEKKHTPCKLCIFAEYNDITQIGCKLNMLATFRNHDYATVIEAYDDEKEFYIINGFKCLYWRHDNWEHYDKPLDVQRKQVSKEIAIKFHAIVFANNSLDDIRHTLNSLLEQKLPPTHITLVRYANSALLPSQLYQIFMAEKWKSSNIVWRIENIVIFDQADNTIIDLIVPFVKATVYSVFYAGFKVPEEMFENLNFQINEQLLYFAMLLPNKFNNGLTVVQQIHERYQGNKDESLKIKLEKDECPCIYPIHKILPEFPMN